MAWEAPLTPKGYDPRDCRKLLCGQKCNVGSREQSSGDLTWTLLGKLCALGQCT